MGDSRMAGFYTYARVEGATYFGRNSMNVFNVFNGQLSHTGGQDLEKLLSERQFGKIYIQLGINEIGYNIDYIVTNFQKVIDKLREKQPYAKIIIMSNMHVTKGKADSQPNVFSNSRIDELNQKLSGLADNSKVFYLAIEHIFDDGNGNMKDEYSYDGTHLIGKYYVMWHDFVLTYGTKY